MPIISFVITAILLFSFFMLLFEEMKVAIYLRVSTDKQSVESQRHAIENYVQRRGWDIVAEYSDIESAAKKRLGQEQLFADALKKKFDAVIVFRFDRFARSLKDLLESLDLFRQCGVAFVSISEEIDTTTPTGWLMFQLVGAMAEFERSILIERTKTGLAVAKAKGKKLGRPPLFVDRENVLKMRQEGKSLRAIAKKEGCSAASIMRILKCFVPCTQQCPY